MQLRIPESSQQINQGWHGTHPQLCIFHRWTIGRFIRTTGSLRTINGAVKMYARFIGVQRHISRAADPSNAGGAMVVREVIRGGISFLKF